MTTTIDHRGHDHVATAAARERCRVETRLRALANYPEPERHGSVFRDESLTLWQRLELAPENVQIGDTIAGWSVTGTSADATHDNEPAYRFGLEQEGVSARLVVQRANAPTINVYRHFDPDTARMQIDLSIESTDPEFVLVETFDMIKETTVIPKMLTFKDIDGYPTVRFTGPRNELITVLKRFTKGWEDLLPELQPEQVTI